MANEVQMIYLSWQDIMDAAVDVADKIRPLNPKGIIAVARGGLIPVGLVSELLPNRNVHVISMATYDDKVQRETAEFFVEAEGDGEGMVILDDLSDTGNSYCILRSKYPKAHFVTLFIKPKGKNFVDMYSKEFPQDSWLVFPWELTEE